MDIMMSDCFSITLEINLTHSFNRYLLRAHPVPGTRDTSWIRKTNQLMKATDAYNTLKVKYRTFISGA